MHNCCLACATPTALDWDHHAVGSLATDETSRANSAIRYNDAKTAVFLSLSCSSNWPVNNITCSSEKQREGARRTAHSKALYTALPSTSHMTSSTRCCIESGDLEPLRTCRTY